MTTEEAKQINWQEYYHKLNAARRLRNKLNAAKWRKEHRGYNTKYVRKWRMLRATRKEVNENNQTEMD